MAKQAVEQIRSAEKHAYEIIEKAKADAKEAIRQAKEQKEAIIDKSVKKAHGEASIMREQAEKNAEELKKIALEEYKRETKTVFSDAEGKIKKTAEKIVPEIFK